MRRSMRRSIRRIKRIFIGNQGSSLSPEEHLNNLHERISRVSDLPIKEAEQELGVTDYIDKSERSGYLSPLIYKKVESFKSKLSD